MTDTGKRVPLDIKAGDRILFGKYSGQEIALDGEAFLIMKADDVLAILEGPVEPRRAAIKGPTAKTTKAKALPSKRTVKKSPRSTRKRKR